MKIRRPSIHSALQDAIVTTINDSNYSFSLPKISDWESIVSSSVDEKQRMEFIGDALMHLSVALYLYRLFPDAAPGLYTNIRSALNANATFTHLMVKAGAYELPSQSHSTKAAADLFEVIVAALYLERGFSDVCTWVQEQYTPLIAAARESYDKCLTTSDRNASLSTKRYRALLKKIRMSSGQNSPRSTLMAQRVINRMKSKGKVKLCLQRKKPKLPLELRLHSCELLTPEPSPRVIDLTTEVSGDGEAAQSNTMQASQLCHLWPQSYSTPSSDRNSHTSIVFHWPPQQSSANSLALSRPSTGSPSSPAQSHDATLRDHAKTITPPATFGFFRRSGLSLPPPLDDVHIPSGSCGNPIVIDDSETEE